MMRLFTLRQAHFNIPNMQLDLARIHFPENLEDPFEVYQEKHFQIKQYFFQRAPIPVVVHKKIKELEVLQDAFEACYPETQIESKLKPLFPNEFSQNWADDFQLLHQARTKYKSLLVAVLSARESIEILEHWYQDELNYALIWGEIYAKADLSAINLSQEPDPMRMLKALREIDFNPNLDNISAKQNHIHMDLQNELKRLSKYVALAHK
jgi:hypothetical protein